MEKQFKFDRDDHAFGNLGNQQLNNTKQRSEGGRLAN